MQSVQQEEIPFRSEQTRRRISCLVLGVTLTALLVLCGGVFSCVLFGYNLLPVILLPYGTNNIHLSRPISTNTIYIYSGHRATVNAVAWEPDGKRVASADDNGTVHIWDANGGGGVTIYSGPSGAIQTLSWAPDGQTIAAGYNTGTVQLWDAATGAQRYTYQSNASTIAQLAWAPDSKSIAALERHTGSSSSINIWDTTTGNTATSITGESTFAWSPDGKRIASYDGINTVTVYDSTHGKLLQTFTLHNNSGIGVDTLAWSPDGKQLNLASSNNAHLQIWNVNSGVSIISQEGHKNPIQAIAWSPDLRYIATASQDETVNIWNAHSGALLYTYPCYVGIVTSVAWSPDGKRIASGSGSEIPSLGVVKDDTVQVWKAPIQ